MTRKMKRSSRAVAQFRVIRSRKMRRRKIRRFLTLTILVTIFVYAASTVYASRRSQLNEVRATLEIYQQELDEILLRQGYYENQVIRLEDEDYIAMLARERYNRTRPNEIVFRIQDASDIYDELDEDE